MTLRHTIRPAARKRLTATCSDPVFARPSSPMSTKTTGCSKPYRQARKGQAVSDRHDQRRQTDTRTHHDLRHYAGPMPHRTLPIPFWRPGRAPHETPPFGGDPAGAFPARLSIAAMAEQMAEIEAIAAQAEAASFDNTIAALERSGRALDRVSSLFHALAGAHTNDALMAIEREMSPRLAAHRNRIHCTTRLYARIKALWDRRGRSRPLARSRPACWSAMT